MVPKWYSNTMWVSEDPTPPENVFQAKAVGERKKWKASGDTKKVRGKNKDYRKGQSKQERGEVTISILTNVAHPEKPNVD